MEKKLKTTITTLTLTSWVFLAQGEAAWGWGSYGHQQINTAAIDLIKQSAIGTCLEKNRSLITRLSVTPDLDWKMSSQDHFALKVYRLAEQLPKNPTDAKLLGQLKKILDQESKNKKSVLHADLISALGKQPGNAANLNRMKEIFLEKGKLGKLSPEVIKRKGMVDWVEHSMHFWEADAYLGEKTLGALSSLPASKNFDGDVLGVFQSLLQKNEAYLKTMDPCPEKTANLSRRVVQHGTAPWRVQSLLESGASALKNAVVDKSPEKLKLALIYLGTLGHYVGDLGQPFHTTLNYNGQGITDYSGPATLGIHSIYETKILEKWAKQKVKIKQDSETRNWNDFSGTSENVTAYANAYVKAHGKKPISPQDGVIPALYRLVEQGFSYTKPLLLSFKEARLADPKFQQLELPIDDCSDTKRGPSTAIHAVTVDKFITAPLPGFKNASGHDLTVIESAEKRMGEAAAVLAQIWLTAVQLAQVDEAALKEVCGSLTLPTFDGAYAAKQFREDVILNYPQISHHKPVSDFNKYESSQADDKDNVEE